MSSKRGRKRNDNLPPNRARDVQRAFRARRAAHLEALEQRVSELEEENATLRSALNLPPANRPLLGKGPTGKDKPKPYSPSPDAVPARIEVPTPLSFDAASSRHGGSSGESPDSARTHSLSPAILSSASLRPSPHPSHISIDTNSWDQSMLLDNQNPSPPSTGYSISSVASHKPSPPQYAYSNQPSSSAAAASSRALSSGMYVAMSQNSIHQQQQQQQQHHHHHHHHDISHPSDRTSLVDSYGGPSQPYPVRDLRDEPSPFSYPPQQQQQQHAFSAPDALQSTHPQHSPPPSASLPYNARRALTEPQTYRSLQYPNLPPPHSHSHSSFSRLSPPRLPDASHLLRPPYSGTDQ